MNQQITYRKDGQEYSAVIAKSFISNVFSYMFAALAITAVIAYWFGTSQELLGYLLNFETGSMTGLGLVVAFSPLAFVLIMTFAFNRLSSMALLLLFIAYSILMGMSLSFIFAIYTGASIVNTFAVSSLTFGAMALVGYTTKTDLTKFGSILTMGLIGIIIASIINYFMGSETMELMISILGVLIFTGLTAYDVQKLKRIGAGAEYGPEALNKLSILGALNLYLDFINLFLFLLRFLGNRK